MRLRNIKDKDTELSNSPYIIDNPVLHKGKWKELFKNTNPIYIEIGMGQGKFIIDNAEKFPKINFIGIEMFDNVLVRAARNLEEIKFPNLKLFQTDAKDLLTIFSGNEVARIYLNFSDPWPKNRHEKRRLTSKGFLDVYKSILDGEIHFKTDNDDLFEYSKESFLENGFKLKNISKDLINSDYHENITTEYEDRFNTRGKNINRLEAKKQSK